MHPFLSIFIKLTGLVAAVIVAVLVLGFITVLLVKVVVIAAAVAAVIMAGLFVYNLIARRKQLPVGR